MTEVAAENLQVPERGSRWSPAFLGNVALSIVFLLFALATFKSWQQTHRPNGLAVCAYGVVVCVCFLVRRSPISTATRGWQWLVAIVGGCSTFALRPGDIQTNAVGDIGLVIEFGGTVLTAIFIFNLGRAFGVVPANRGIRASGAYRIVRHPVYAAEGLIVLGYVLENPRAWNIFVMAVALVIQLTRIRLEETHLRRDLRYVAYAQHVRWRLVPGVY
jgi:protein-S-isoprenylcysteine O-methyltransferase Ste14